MTTLQVWDNIVAYTLQIGLLVGLGALVPVVLKLRVPRARLLFWQVLLVACLALPWVRPWRQEVVNGAIQVSTAITAVTPASAVAPVRHAVPFREIALWLLATGVAIRLVLLGVGLARLAAYRRRGQDIQHDTQMTEGRISLALLLSDDVSGPVTFGWLRPVVLLPTRFPSLGAEMREAILRHELMHVNRRDWLFTMAEELVRAFLWFHPAIWWVIGEIQLAREQTVDRAVIETTGAREPYLDALLLMAGVPVSLAGSAAQMDLAPAPMFLRRRHLKRRLMEAMREVRMATISKTRLVCALGAAVAMVAAACWLATGAFPLSAAPQVVADAPGVSVNINGSQLMHRSPVAYPVDAMAKGVEGTVVIQVRLDANGEVVDAAVLSGPDELRRAAQQSVLTWHFDKSAALTTQSVNIDFRKPAAVTAPATTVGNTQPVPEPRQIQRKTVADAPDFAQLPQLAQPANLAPPPPPPPPPPPTSGKLARIEVTGLSDSARDELLSLLPIREGGEWSPQMLGAVGAAAKKFDSHLVTILTQPARGELELRIGPGLTPTSVGAASNSGASVVFTVVSGAGIGAGTGGGIGGGIGGASATSQTSTSQSSVPSQPAAAPTTPGVFRLGNGVSPPSVLFKVDPVLPEEAGAGPVAGTVVLSCVVGADGKAADIRVVKSLGVSFDANAIEAVSKWVFKPGTLNGVPVGVRATIEVNFRKL
jgi:TonB family protein